MTSRRTSLPYKQQSFNQEILVEKRPSSSGAREIGLQAASKIVDSIPELIELTKMVVEVKKVEAQAEAMAHVLQEQTKAFVQQEWERRRTVESKGQIVSDLMQKLQAQLSIPGISTDVQKMLVENCNVSISLLLEKSEEA